MENYHLKITENIVINKDQKSIWDILTDVNNWGRWNPSIDHAAIYGQLREGTNFKCNSSKWEFDCKISKLELEQNIIFQGYTIGLSLILAWQLERDDQGTKVVISLNATGWMVSLFRNRLSNYFEYILHRWLTSLKTQAERGVTVVNDNNTEEESSGRQGNIFTTPFSFLSDLKKSREQKRDRLK